MTRINTWLLDFKADVYSQTGEDGIIKKILETLPKRDKWCVEFGAWDGRYLSNTRNLIDNYGYSAVLIEGSKEKFTDLQKNCVENDKVVAINQFVGFTGEDNLDHILATTQIPKDFDFLSIDIDGNDYHAWSTVVEYKPKAVCIEFNPTIPTEVHFVQAADPSVTQGCSLSALVELGKKKGYELVSVLPFNAFFVRSDYYPLFKISDNSPQALRQTLDYITYIFVGYDGRLFLRGCRKMLWHQDFEIKEDTIQQLPRFLLTYSGNYTKIQFALFLLLTDPRTFANKLIGRIKRFSLRR
jgi:hypothetical protein